MRIPTPHRRLTCSGRPPCIGQLLTAPPSTEVVRALLEAHPAAASTASRVRGNLPLHFATIEHAPVGVVAALHAAYPEGAAVRNNAGHLPDLSAYLKPAILAALKAAAAARRWRAPIAWHMWHRM